MKKILCLLLSVLLTLSIVTSTPINTLAANLATPKLTSVSNATSGISVKWKKVSNATRYRVYRRGSNQSNWTYLDTVTSNNFLDKKVSGGKFYRYTVRAVKGKKLSSYNKNGLVIKRLTNPQSIKAANKTFSIDLTWAKTTGATGYRVYLYSPNKDEYIVKASVKDTTTYKVTGLKTGTTYKFKIKPYVKTDDGTVIWGGASSALATATKPATPKLKSATASSGKATLNWADVSSESGYQIYYSTSKSGNYEKMKSVSTDTLKYTTSKLTAGKTYYFKVRAYIKVDGKVIYGDFSDVKSVIIKKATSSGSSNSSGSSSNSSSSSSSKPEIGVGTYYITNTGKKYHVSGCRTLRGSKIAVSYEYASRNYEPCGVCLN